jgi:hypothetical protein
MSKDTPKELQVLPGPWDTAADSEVHESLAELTDEQVAAMLGPIVHTAVTIDRDWLTLVATFVADIRAAERIRLRRGH